MARAYSGDLRVRVICRRAAARRLGVGDSTATAWVGRWRRTGSPSAVTPPAEPPDARDQRARLFPRRLHRGEGFSAHIRPRALQAFECRFEIPPAKQARSIRLFPHFTDQTGAERII